MLSTGNQDNIEFYGVVFQSNFSRISVVNFGRISIKSLNRYVKATCIETPILLFYQNECIFPDIIFAKVRYKTCFIIQTYVSLTCNMNYTYINYIIQYLI